MPGQKNGMFNKSHTESVKSNQSLRQLGVNKGKTYIEMYGKEMAERLKHQRSLSSIGKDNSRKKNPRALRIQAISPNNEIFIIEGGINKFCKEHNLGEKNVRISAMTGRPHYLGWKFKLLGKVFNQKERGF